MDADSAKENKFNRSSKPGQNSRKLFEIERNCEKSIEI